MPKRTSALQKNNLHLKGQVGPKTSGHEVDFGTYTSDNDSYTSWITKRNKHEGVDGETASVLEVAFSAIAELFIKPDLTPPARIVLDEEHVMGVASENFNVKIKKIADGGKICYSFDPKNWAFTAISTAEPSAEQLQEERAAANDLSDNALKERLQLKAAQKGVHFLDKMPEDFFHTLMKKHKSGELRIDMSSLSSVLSASFVLEEDDLHKGNIGFYVTDAEDSNNPGQFKKLITFFKIDHDLMFTDSIMSKTDMRIANISYDKDSFKITRRDLKNFPDLQDSGNHYWPTKKRFIVAGSKAYNSAVERQTYADLKNDPEFTNAKWADFLKYCLTPIELVEKSLTIHLDPEKDGDKIHMIRNSVNARLVKLKETLLRTPEFLEYLQSENGEAAKNEIKNDLAIYMKNAGMEQQDQEQILAKVDKSFEHFGAHAQEDYLSPLQKRLALDCYRFSYSKKPTEGEVDYANTLFEWHKSQGDKSNAFKYACIVVNLIAKSDLKDDVKKQKLVSVNDFKKDYLNIKSITTIEQFRSAADSIQRSNLPLKQQKLEITAVLKDSKLSMADLNVLKMDLEKKEPKDPSLKFINQYRSSLWFVRKLFGLYGKTSTCSTMLEEIEDQMKTICKNRTTLCRERFHAVRKEHNPVIAERAEAEGSQPICSI